MISTRIAAALKGAAPGAAAMLEVLVLLAGVGLVAYGAWQAYPPAGPITGGILLIAGVILRARGG